MRNTKINLKLSNVLNYLPEFFDSCYLESESTEQEILPSKYNDLDYSENINKLSLMRYIMANFEKFYLIFNYSEKEFNSINFEIKNNFIKLRKILLDKNEKSKPINLLSKYSYDKQQEYIQSFENFKEKITGFVDTNTEHDLSVGDIIQFKNGYDIEIITQILGFDSDGDCYLLWDCYWSPIRLNERFTKLINKSSKKEYSGKFVWDYIVEITEDNEMIPTGFEQLIVNEKFILIDNYNLNDLLKSDIDFKYYYESGEERYEDGEKSYNDSIQPIVIVDNILLDGYSRASHILRYFDEQIANAYINIKK